MKIRHLIFICIIMLFSDCSKKKESHQAKSITKIRVNVEDTSSTLKASSIFQATRFVKLETTDESLLGRTGKLKTDAQDKIYIKSSSKIFVFNKHGKFLHKIAREGKGPGEYLHITDFYIDTINNTIEILDLRGKKLMRYDLQGNFVAKWKHNMYSEAFTKLSDNKYAFYNGSHITDKSNHKLVIGTFQNKNPIVQYFKITKNQYKYLYIITNHNFTYYNNRCLFFYPENDTVYNLYQNNRLNPRYIIDFGDNTMPDEFLQQEYKNIKDFMESFHKNDYASIIDSFFETEDYIVFKFSCDEKQIWCVYHKSKQNTLSTTEIQEDLNFGGQPLDYFITPLYKEGDKFYYLIQAHLFLSKIENLKKSLSNAAWNNYKSTHEQVMELYRSTEESDNPILGIYKLK